VKPIPNFENLFASKSGLIYIKKDGKFKEVPQPLAHGYPTISFKSKRYGVRALVCAAFGLPESKFYIHKDMNVENNEVSNLVAVDGQTYFAYIAMKNGLDKIGWQKGKRYCKGEAGELRNTLESKCEYIRLYFQSKDIIFIQKSFDLHFGKNTHERKNEFAGELYEYFYNRCTLGYGLENPFTYIFTTLKFLILREKLANLLQYKDNMLPLKLTDTSS
jgi:hypothetical protein